MGFCDLLRNTYFMKKAFFDIVISFSETSIKSKKVQLQLYGNSTFSGVAVLCSCMTNRLHFWYKVVFCPSFLNYLGGGHIFLLPYEQKIIFLPSFFSPKSGSRSELVLVSYTRKIQWWILVHMKFHPMSSNFIKIAQKMQKFPPNLLKMTKKSKN